MATNSWSSSSGLGNFLDAANWSDGSPTVAGEVDVVGYGDPSLENAAVDGFTIDIVSAQTLEAELTIGNATLGTGMLIEDTNSTNGAAMLVDGSVTNDGTMLFDASVGGEYNGFSLNFEDNTDTLTNNGAIDIASSDGLFLGNGDGGTLVNNGVIYDGAARTFFNSPVVGAGTIALAGATLAIGYGSDVSPDQTILFTDGISAAQFSVSETGTGGVVGTVEDFQKGDLLDFPYLFLTSAGYSYDPGTRILSLSTDSGTLEVHMAGSIAYTRDSFTVGSDTSEGFEIGTTALPCFATGTRIRTPRGEVAVENLAEGELVVTASGGTAPVRWLGHRRVACARHPRPWDVMPVRIMAGAIGRARPRRDLLLSPDHALFIDGSLIPARYLLNGATIAQVEVSEVEYWHVELPCHDVLLAEGLPAESYLDTGNRGAFANGDEGLVKLHPAFALRVWESAACAPLVRDGDRLTRVRRRMLSRAAALGYTTTREPALHLRVAGRVVMPQVLGRLHRFVLPAGAGNVVLLSRSIVPAQISADGDDSRRLGVAVERVLLDGEALKLTDARFGRGWHAVETGGLAPAWRWTNGAAGMTLGRGRVLDIVVAATERYWIAPGGAVAVASA